MTSARRASRRRAVREAAPRASHARVRGLRAFRPAWGWLVPAVLAVALYAGSLGWGWVWDDHQLIEQNAALRSPSGVAHAMAGDFWATSGPNASGLWRPLVTLSYALDGVVSHWQPGWFRVENVAAHALVAALVAVLALAWGLPGWAALLAGSWFAVMPAHVESVAWISGRTDVLCAVGFVLALVLDERARHRGARWPGWGAMGCLAVALLSKETALPYVAVVAVAERVRGRTWREAARWLAPYAAVTAAYLAVHTLLVRAPATPVFVDPQALALGRRGVLLMLPGYLAFLMPWFPHTAAVTLSLADAREPARLVLGVAVHVALPVVVVWAALRRRPVAMPLALLYVTLLPTLAVDLTHGYMLYAERLFYLPSIGAALALAHALASPRLARMRGPAVAAAVALVVASAVAAWRTLPAWSDDAAQFAAQVRLAPGNYAAHVQWARQLLNAGRFDDAARELDRATALDPNRPEAMSVRAALHFRRGEMPQALADARDAIAHGDGQVEPALVAATALLSLGRAGEARGLVDSLRARAPDQPPVVSLYGQWLLAGGHAAEAEPVLERAAAYDAGNADLVYMTGIAHEQARHWAAARDAFHRALALQPAHYDAWLGVARASAWLGDVAGTEGAIEHAEVLPAARDGRAATLRAMEHSRLGAGIPAQSPVPAVPPTGAGRGRITSTGRP